MPRSSTSSFYRAIVRRQVRSLFNQANAGNWAAIVDGLAENFTYRFVGDTPLGGTRTTDKAMRLWFERLYRLFPGSQFAPQNIVVEGPPWNTRIMTYVKIQGTAPTATGGQRPYENEFMQRLVLRWGKVAPCSRSKTRNASSTSFRPWPPPELPTPRQHQSPTPRRPSSRISAGRGGD